MKTYRLVAVPCLAGLLSVQARAVISTFASGFDGWTQTSGVSWTNSGGNPGGFLRFQDTGPADGGLIYAPASFLGDWSTLYGSNGVFSVDYTLIRAGTLEPFPMFVRITGSGGQIARNFAGDFSTPFDWTTMSVSLTPGNWALLSGTFAGALSNVTEVRISMSSASSSNEITGVDNVSVVPEPATLASLAVVIGALGRRRQS